MEASEHIALVVDDNEINRKLVQHMLRRLGWQTVAADSGLRALDLLRERVFDLVLLDLRMPNLSGEQTCRRIRDDLGQTETWTVAYTAHGMPAERARMLASGFDDLLIKPVSFDDLRETCAKALAAPVRVK